MIEVINLSKKYPPDLLALSDICLSIEKGDVFGIIGQSGAGKSSLIRALAALLTPTSGKILFHGKNIADFDSNELQHYRKKIGMVFQHFNLLSSRTVFENIAFPMEIANLPNKHERICELLDLVGLKHKKNAYPSQLSGGEKQRVGIARALATSPELLLCDEATSALDPKTTKEILDLLKKINQSLGVTMFLITHEMEVIKRICNKVAVMEHGKIVEMGSVAKIFAEPKHPITINFLENVTHTIPEEFIKEPSPNRKLLRLTFKGNSAKEPIISHLVRKCNVDANILLGWLEHLGSSTIGNLVVELIGSENDLTIALLYLKEQSVHYEEISK